MVYEANQLLTRVEMIIYKIENNINGKIYIGLTTKDLSKRIAGHIAENKSYIQKALNKYGLQSFTVSVIDSAESREILCEKEKYWIQHYGCKAPNGYNLTDGGDGLINPSEIVRNRIAEAVRKLGKNPKFTFEGRKHSEKSKRKTSKSCKKTLESPGVRKKMSDAGKAKVLSEATKKKISKAKTGKKRTDAVWNKGLKMSSIVGYVNPMKGKKRPDLSERNKLGKGRKDSEETKLRKSLAGKGKPKTKEHILHIAEAKAYKKGIHLIGKREEGSDSMSIGLGREVCPLIPSPNLT
jgi:group I intron endonuclease